MTAVDVVLGLLLLATGLLGHRLLAGAGGVPRGEPDARGGPDAPGVLRASQVSVVVPARNEAQTLPLLLGSLARLTAHPAEVVVVDDASHDDTAAVAHGAGARVVLATPPPPGWTGKAWACHQGSEASTGPVLLFLDADTVLEPEALDGLLTLLERHGGLVSVQPSHRTRRAYEQLSAYFNLMALLASGAFARRPVSSPMAFGPVLLTSRRDYDSVGGHVAVRAEILDDARLAAAYDGAGLPVHCVLGGASVRMRMYPAGLRQLVEGWTKNIASGAAAADPRSATAAGLWLAGHWAVTVGAALSLVSVLPRPGLLGPPPAPGTADALLLLGHPGLWAVAWVGVSLQVRAMLHTAGSFRWWAWALFPVPLLAFTLVFARSLVLTTLRHQVGWRGRTVSTRPSRPLEDP